MILGKLYFFSKSVIACIRLYFNKTFSTVCYMILKLTKMTLGSFFKIMSTQLTHLIKHLAFVTLVLFSKVKLSCSFLFQLDSVINASY